MYAHTKTARRLVAEQYGWIGEDLRGKRETTSFAARDAFDVEVGTAYQRVLAFLKVELAFFDAMFSRNLDSNNQ